MKSMIYLENMAGTGHMQKTSMKRGWRGRQGTCVGAVTVRVFLKLGFVVFVGQGGGAVCGYSLF